MKGSGGGACAVHDRVEPQGAPAPPADDIQRELQAVLDSPHFDASPRSRAFLRFIVEETLGGRQAGLTQLAIATRVFGRREDFDPTIDPVVRIQAGRLRRSLERLYLMAGPREGIRLELPRGTYVPVFRHDDARAGGDAPLESVGDRLAGIGEGALAHDERVACLARFGDELRGVGGRRRDLAIERSSTRVELGEGGLLSHGGDVVE